MGADIPLLLALFLLDLPQRLVHSTAINRWGVPFHMLSRGHLGVRLDCLGESRSRRPL